MITSGKPYCMPLLTVLFLILLQMPAQLLAEPPYKLMAAEALKNAKIYSEEISKPTTEAVDPEIQSSRSEWAETRLTTSEKLHKSVCSLPSATETIDFFKTLEVLKEKKEQLEREAAFATEQAKLALQGKKDDLAELASEKQKFYAAMANIVATTRKAMGHSLRQTYRNEKIRKKVVADAFRKISAEKAQETELARKKAAEATETLEQKKKDAEEMAERAKAELGKAKSKEETELANLRLTYAHLTAEVEDFRATSYKAEAKARNAEESFQQSRAKLTEIVPSVLKMAPGAPQVSRKRETWKKRIDKLQNSAELLDKKSAVLRENIAELRIARDKKRREYDELYKQYEAKRSNKIYRQCVFFSRQISRFSADKLDLFRTRIEWIEKEKKHLLRNAESYQWALKATAKHLELLYLGQKAEQWYWFLLGLVLTYAGAFVIRELFNFVFRRFATQSRWQWDNVVMEELGLPIRILAILAGLWMTLKILTLSKTAWHIASMTREALQIVWLALLAWRLLNIVTRVLKPKFEATDTTLDDQLLKFVGRGLRLVVVVVSLIYLLETFGWKVSSLLAGLGIGGLAFALAAKDTLANLFGSIVLFLDRPFTVGNWVKIGGAEGIVEDIGIRSTQIRTFKDTVVTIPNATVADSPAENIHSFRKRRLYFTLTLRLDTPVKKVEETVERVREILTDHPMILDGFYVYVSGIPADGVEIMVYCFVATRDWGEWLHHGQTVFLSVLRMLEEIEVGLAYGTQTIELENKFPIEIRGLAGIDGAK